MPAVVAQQNTAIDTADLKKSLVQNVQVPQIDINAIVKNLSDANAETRQAAAEEVANAVKEGAFHTIYKYELAAKLNTLMKSKKSTNARQGGVATVLAIAEVKEASAEPFYFEVLDSIYELHADKASQEKATAALAAILAAVNPASARLIVKAQFLALENSRKWQTKQAALQTYEWLVKNAPSYFLTIIEDVLPVLSEVMWDTKPEIRSAAKTAIETVCTLIDNKDIEKFIPAVIHCITNPEEVPETIHLVGATTFVQEVQAPTLALMAPLLIRGLKERETAIRRKSALIIDNMCKLVEQPEIAAPFIPKLLPGLQKVQDEVADPECREVVKKAFVTLNKLSKDCEGVDTVEAKQAKTTKTLEQLCDKLFARDNEQETLIQYVSNLAATLTLARDFEPKSWNAAVIPYLCILTDKKATESLAEQFLTTCYEAAEGKIEHEDDDEGEDLCNCDFSLAYGAKILLNRANLRLKRGRRYGLCGPNGSGKSTLMRAIVNGQVEGFPDRTQLKTVYVEHDIDASEADIVVVDFVVNDAELNVTREEVVKALTDFGFPAEMQAQSVGSLSGGWKMKLALARAMLLNADILLLDEPTNHLDVVNVAWLENYLNGLENVTSMVVSHDSGFLDNVCTHIIHYERFKLRRYKGNLSEFVKKVPAAAAYYDLGAAEMKFKFPAPGFLEGVKTKEKAILKMQKVNFTYPGSSKQQLYDISMQCSLGSRVAVIGPNGAGKSTLIKLLCGEMEPDSGVVWRHPNLRIAYVAQHAFHHIESHLDSTPNEYIQWRYATGEDREELDKVHRQINEEEEKEMSKVQVIDGQKRVVDSIVGRRKLKQSYEYEVSWVNCSSVDNTWLPRKTLEDMGFAKKLQEVDAAEAAKLGLNRPLTRKEIEKHLEDVGLEAEFGTHSRIRGLSGGQKVKLVIGAAMWNKPHMLVLDEPTNYLDRESLGALAHAIKEFEGGVVIITHNRQFSEALCKEVWAVDNGRLTPSGHNWVKGQGSGPKIAEGDEDAEPKFDAMGNLIKNEKKKKLSASELRKKKKDRMARRKRGEEVFSDEDDL
ncbi:hypothetical protein BZG36_02492 [Bifiguratus adelaidae]|uniref:ABC transporter domain-containing protein n=1 Tax=Bifiguratus adelaidae TaxID=1938954 RepID=A0A261Y2U9_9FUNG|nr:hypothetical protein BZG36_02492 [Bifiguratus adelaidae]